ncbi:MAG: GNAT family N-acetyltransferase [Cellvibrionaceae bacterium]|nr:GNAT family N-acetyltransferase [Cellvibrionaceae bacterium]
MIQIVPLSNHLEFIDELAALHYQEWRHFSPESTVADQKQSLMDSAKESGIPSLYIAIEGGELLGSAALVESDLDERFAHMTPWLAAVYVKEQARGRGLASLLVQHCEQEASRLGLSTLYLSTEHAGPLYEKLGWIKLQDCNYKGYPLDVMQKDLSGTC